MSRSAVIREIKESHGNKIKSLSAWPDGSYIPITKLSGYGGVIKASDHEANYSLLEVLCHQIAIKLRQMLYGIL